MVKAKLDKQTVGEKSGKGRRFSRLTFHSLRHGINSRLANLGTSQDVRKLVVGHSSDSVNDGYTHLSSDTMRTAINQLGSVL
jgi:integrase